MKLHLRLLLLLAMLFAFALPAAAQESIEPGDEIEEELDDNETHEYVFEAEEGFVYIIAVASDEFDTTLRLLDEDGDEVAYNDDFGGTRNSQISYSPSDDGEYTIIVGSFGSRGGEYTLTLEAEERQAFTELEPGQTVEGIFSTGVSPRYEIELLEGEYYAFFMRESGYDSTLTLYDSRNQQIDYDDDGGWGRNPLILFTPPRDALYTIEVGAFSGTGSYVLSAEILDTEEIEVGDSVDVELTDEPVLFLFEGESNDIVSVLVDSDDDAPVLLTLYQLGDGYIYDLRSAEFDSFGEDPELHNVTLASRGTYGILLVPNEDAEGESLTLTLEESEILALSENPVEVELDNSGNSALLSLEGEEGDEFLITIVTEDEIDYLSFYVSLAMEYEFTTTSLSVSGTGQVTFLYTMPADGTALLTLTSYSSENVAFSVTAELVD